MTFLMSGNSQSHHDGIEIDQSLRLPFAPCFSQSHHDGIEIFHTPVFVLDQYDSQSHHDGIEIVVGHLEVGERKALNRTMMELKSKWVKAAPKAMNTLNRTMMELK